MLKLERVRTSRGVAVRLREKEKLLNKVFLRAAFLALGLHFAALFLFQVERTQCEECVVTIDPSKVDTDISQPSDDSTCLSQLTMPSGVLPRYVLEPEPPLPKKPEHLSSICQKPEVVIAESTHVFPKAHEIPLEPENLKLSFPHPITPIALDISGPIANDALIHRGTASLEKPRITEKSCLKLRATYQVHVDPSCGKIFWFEKQGPTSAEDRLAEAVLKRMRFTPIPKERAAYLSLKRGIVEITFEIEEGQNPDELIEQLQTI